VAGGACCFAVTFKHRFGYDDALDVVGVHLVGGLVGTLMIGVVADSEFAAGYESIVDGGSFTLLGKQAVAAVAVMTYSFVVTALIALVVKATVGLRTTEEEEVTGIDQTVHAETAYELGGGFGGTGTGTLPAPTGVPSSTRVSS
jgi:Amt family ammonium transporter